MYTECRGAGELESRSGAGVVTKSHDRLSQSHTYDEKCLFRVDPILHDISVVGKLAGLARQGLCLRQSELRPKACLHLAKSFIK